MKLAICLLGFILIFLFAGILHAQEGLVLYFSFDNVEGDQIQDESGKKNNGTSLGGFAIVDGKKGKALEVDGVDGRVEVPDSDSLDLGKSSMTIDCWVNSTAQGGYRRVISKGNFSWTAGYIFQLYEGKLPAISISDQSKKAIYVTGKDVMINDGVWHHVAGVVDREKNEVRMYVDGKLVASDLPLAQAKSDLKDIGDISNTNKLAIGSDDQKPRELVQGIIDELRIWGKALTASDIQLLVKGEILPSSVKPVEKLSIKWGELKLP